MATKSPIPGSNGLTAAAKDMITATRNWHGAAREVGLSPVVQTMHTNGPMTTMLGPVVDMTRRAHETWLDAWETGTHEIIDKSVAMVDEVMRRTTAPEPPPAAK